MLRKLVLIAAAATALLAVAPAAEAQAPGANLTPQAGVQPPRSVVLPMNKSLVFKVNQPIGKIAIGNAEIADAVALTETSFYIYGKKAGSTTVSVHGRDGKLLAVLDVNVGVDVDAVKTALHDVLPNEAIAVRTVGDSVALSGSVNSAAKVARAVEVAKHFVDKDRTVVNDLRVTGTQQVMLEVKIAEMQRNVSKEFGFKPFLNIGKPGNPSGFSLTTFDNFPIPKPETFARAAVAAISGNFAFSEALDLLESKGAAKILAEPNLVAMSGDTASFLVGGEFPIPIASTPPTTNGGVTTITIEFKTFGISLAFTPTVVDVDLINLVIAPEVSQIDRTNGITLSNLVIPGIATRRAKTTIELRDGQSFAIAGLLSSDFNDTLNGIPGMMDVPVLGALFRSSQYQRNETELVIIATPHLVQPVPAGTLLAPTDSFVPPSDPEIFLMGHTENPDSGMRASGGGLTGKYGHIIR